MSEKKTRTKRRRTQFSLRTLLTLMLVAPAFFAGRMPVQRELDLHATASTCVAGFVWGRPRHLLLAHPVFLLVFLVRFR
jgi:hypothetical protein